jgi:uncharacterized GH25 family protein
MPVAQGAGWVTKGLRELTAGGYNPFAVTLEAGKATTADVVVVPGARIEGTVTDADGSPVVGAYVRADSQGSSRGGGGIWAPRSPSGPDGVATAADGAYALDSLYPGDSYLVFATAPGRPGARSDAVVVEEAKPARVDLRFPAGRWVAVTVLDDGASTPISGATVWGQVANRGGGSSTPVTGSDGTTKAGPFEPGPLKLSANHSDYLSGAQTDVPEGQATAVIRLKRGVPLAGRVVRADGSPAPDVRVQVDYDERTRYAGSEGTDADGRFRFKAVPPGPLTLHVYAGSGQAEGRATGGDENVTLVLAGASGREGGSGSTLVVRVFAPNGKPVPQARVTLEEVRERGGTNTSTNDAVNGETTFQGLTWTAGRERFVEVRTARDGAGVLLPYGGTRVGPLTSGSTSLDVTLPPERPITGFVRGPDGRGIRGVLVLATPASNPRESSWSDPSNTPSGRTDAEGAFRVGGVGDMDVRLAVRAPPEFVPYEPLPARGGDTGIEIVLALGVRATVTVVDPDGAPIAGARVTTSFTVDRERNRTETSNPAVTTDAKGRAVLQGLDGKKTYTLRVEPPQRYPSVPYSMGPTMTASEGAAFRSAQKKDWTPGDDTVTLERAYTVTGFVRDLSGRPVGGSQVARMTGPNSWSTTAADASGAFTLRDLPAGEVSLRAWVGSNQPHPADAGRRVAEAVVAAGARDVVLSIDPGAELVVRVEDWAEGPRSSNYLQAYELGPQQGGPAGSSPVDSEGVARVRGLYADRTYLVWTNLQGGRYVYVRDVQPGREVRARIETGTTIAGRIAMPSGAASGFVNAQAWPVNLQAQVGPDGRFEVKGVPLGLTWRLSVQCQVGDKWWRGVREGVASGASGLDVEVADR